MIRASVVGASGYSGGELMRLLSRHPDVELVTLTASRQAGRQVEESFPSLRGFVDGPLVAPEWSELSRESDVVFLALPHGVSMTAAGTLLEGGARVVDLGADFRLRDPDLYRQWYALEHQAAELLEGAVYGLPELGAEGLPEAKLVACPGCYPTAALLAMLPALEFRQPGASVIIDAKSGVSGAGRAASASTHFGEVNENVRPYNVGRHRHTPEIEQGLATAGAPERVLFAPHLIPMTRGILATCYLRTDRPIAQEELDDAYRRRYEAWPFVRVLLDEPPETKMTQGSNFCDVSVRAEPQQSLVVGMAALDNLVKGAAGQAIQCMNLMFGVPQEQGLWQAPLFP